MPSIFDLCSSKSCLFKLSGSVIVSFPSFVLGSAGMELKLPGLQKKAGYSAILNEPAVCCSLRYPTCFVILTIPTLPPPPIPSKVTLLDSNINIVNTAALPDIIGMPISVGICIYAPTKKPTLFDHYSHSEQQRGIFLRRGIRSIQTEPLPTARSYQGLTLPGDYYSNKQRLIIT